MTDTPVPQTLPGCVCFTLLGRNEAEIGGSTVGITLPPLSQSTDAINEMRTSSAATSEPRDCEKRLGDFRAMAEQAVIENRGWVFLLTYHIPRPVRVCLSTVMFLYYLTDTKCYWNSDTVHLFLKNARVLLSKVRQAVRERHHLGQGKPAPPPPTSLVNCCLLVKWPVLNESARRLQKVVEKLTGALKVLSVWSTEVK